MQGLNSCCCHGPLAPLAMGDYVDLCTILTRYESMQLRSLRQSERTTARDPIQHKRWTYPCRGPSIRNINKYGHADGVRHLPNIWHKMIIGVEYIEGTYMVYLLWIKLCHKYRTVAIIFYPTHVNIQWAALSMHSWNRKNRMITSEYVGALYYTNKPH